MPPCRGSPWRVLGLRSTSRLQLRMVTIRRPRPTRPRHLVRTRPRRWCLRSRHPGGRAILAVGGLRWLDLPSPWHPWSSRYCSGLRGVRRRRRSEYRGRWWVEPTRLGADAVPSEWCARAMTKSARGSPAAPITVRAPGSGSCRFEHRRAARRLRGNRLGGDLRLGRDARARSPALARGSGRAPAAMIT
jgi:hypothetical protein